MIKAIIFDCFGVLVGKGFDYTYGLAGGDPKKDEAFIDELLDKANLGVLSNHEFTLKIAEHLNITLKDWQKAAEKAELADEQLLGYIRELRESYKTAILSNSNKDVLSSRISKQWLSEAFDEVIVSADIGLVKPDPRIYQYAADKLGAKINECIFIDNRSAFTDRAEQLGMQAIVYKDFVSLKSQLTKLLN
jgi:putative hydrolase of the HAD superfamily